MHRAFGDAASEGKSPASDESARVGEALSSFIAWLNRYGETSHDHQSFFAGPVGGAAKALYYRNRPLGTLAVAPMILCEAFVPAVRAAFHRKQRFPIADAHYAGGFFMLAHALGDPEFATRGERLLSVLEANRSAATRYHGWGYPFDWVTQTGVMAAGTPLITTTPYAYEAFEEGWRYDRNPRWLEVMRSIAEHAFRDFPQIQVGPGMASTAYHPSDALALVVNASAYRAYLLSSAGVRFGRDDYLADARRNLAYVLDAQRKDGSWPYATDGRRNFVDHFHTCFVLKALAKIQSLLPEARCESAIEAGVRYYAAQLFGEGGLPRPFAVAPRLTVYRQELYDYAECINLGTLLAGRFAPLDARLESTLNDLLERWRKPDGSFRSRRLLTGWDNVPMHRWAQAQLFRSLCQRLLADRVPVDAARHPIPSPTARDMLEASSALH